jgi:hypothetical protein
VRQRAAAKAESAPPDDDEIEQTPVDDEPDDDDDGAEAGPSRSDKKRNRYRAAQERAEAAERDRAELQGRLQQMQQLYDEARAQPLQQRPAEPQRDEVSDKIDQVYREQDLLYRELQAKGKALTQEELQRYEKRARELDETKHELIAERKLKTVQPQGDPQIAAVQAFLRMQYPDVYGSQQALGWAQSRYSQLKYEGRAAGFELLQETMTEARQRFRLAGASRSATPPPKASEKAKYTGAPRGGGAGGGASEEQLTVPRKPEYVRMARSVYAHIAKQMKGKSQKAIEDAQWKKWVQGPGKRLVTYSKEKRARG